jgi:hypothetical protein
VGGGGGGGVRVVCLRVSHLLLELLAPSDIGLGDDDAGLAVGGIARPRRNHLHHAIV